VSLQAGVLAEHRAVQSVRRLGEEGKISSRLAEELKNSLLQGVHRASLEG
jgi:hypothetical protein